MNQTTSKEWQENLNWVLSRVSAKGGEIESPIIYPPIPMSQVKELTEFTGLQLPTDFVDVLTNYTGGLRFSWDLYDLYETNHDWLSETAVRGGNDEVPFIGASKEKSLLALYQEFQSEFLTGSCSWIFNSDFDHDESILETRKVLQFCFPLYLYCGSGGDYTVLRLDTQPAQVLYLDHEWAFSVSDRAILGYGFVDFVTRWSNLGYPETDRYSNFYNEETKSLDGSGRLAREWKAWLDQ